MSNVSINNLSVIGKSTLNGDVSMNGIVTNSTSITLTNQLTTKSYVDSIADINLKLQIKKENYFSLLMQ
jgi:hypothetical protein